MVNRLHQFVLNYSGPKLTIVASGGGSHLSLLTSIPGSSALINAVYHPYSVEATEQFIEGTVVPIPLEKSGESYKSVQSGMAAMLAKSAYLKTKDGIGVGVTAALTTNRSRRGLNEAFIGIYDPLTGYRLWHAVFDKISQDQYARLGKTAIEVVSLSKRQEEDRTLTQIVLDLIQQGTCCHEPCKLVYQSS